MKKGRNYGYNAIEKFANDNMYDIEDAGKQTVGENFLILRHQQRDVSISFVLVGAGNEYIYECIYSDLK